jgi:capsule polysaccharide export protein KpsE/RkpR
MKHLKSYKLFESDNFDWFKELFIDLEDERFRITIKDSLSQKLDFSKSNVINVHQVAYSPSSETIKTIDVKIEKRILEDGHLTFKSFNIDEIKETLRFAESYVKGQEDLNIQYIYTVRVPQYLYYNSVDALPGNQDVDSVIVAFTKY